MLAPGKPQLSVPMVAETTQIRDDVSDIMLSMQAQTCRRASGWRGGAGQHPQGSMKR